MTDPRAGRDSSTTIVLVAIVLTLVGGFLLKGQCMNEWDGRQYSRLCYNDIQPLYKVRGVEEGTFPYVSGDRSEDGLSSGSIEYPVLTGLFMWLMGQFVSNDFNGYLVVTAIGLAPFGIWTAYALAKMAGRRALMWAAAPAVILYAFHNWDLLVVAATVAAVIAWRKERWLASAVLLGIGGALKLYPLMFLAPLMLDVWHRAGWRSGIKEAAKVAVAGAGTFLLINLPFILINFDGWFATYKFHSQRLANYDSLWAQRFPFIGVEDLNLLTAALTLTTFAAVLWFGVKRAGREGRFPFLPVAGALLAAFLLWNKVHSPQYTLWLLPFFVLLRVHYLWWLAYTAVDLMVYIGVFRFFYALQYFKVNPDPAMRAMKIGVYSRAALLALLIVVFVTSRRADTPEEAPEDELVSHPPPTVDVVGERAPA